MVLSLGKMAFPALTWRGIINWECMIGELDLGEDEKPKIGHGTWADLVISFWLGELGEGRRTGSGMADEWEEK